MINLGQYIADVLKQHAEVYVPEVGLFQSARIPASYDKATDSFIPPRRRVILLPDTGPETSLVQAVQAQEQVTEEDARRLISDAVQQLRSFLENGGSAALKGIGELSLQHGQFLLDATDIPHPGLQPVSRHVFPELQPETAMPEETTTEETIKEEITTAPELVEPETVTTDPADEMREAATGYAAPVTDTGYETGERPSRWWIWMLTFIMLAVGAFAVWKYTQQGQGDPQTAGQTTPAVLPDTAADSVTTAGAIADSTFRAADTLAADGTGTAIPDTTKTATGLPPGTVTYEIIIASFKTLQEADEYVNRMNKKGYGMRVIDSKMPGNRKKVSYSSHLKEDDAYRELARVQKQLVADAWLFRLVHD